MKKLYETIEKHQEEQTELFDKYDVFWAFNNEQFKAEKEKRGLENKDLYRWLAGSFVPKKNADKLFDEYDKLLDRQAKELKNYGDDYIRYELANHETTHTHDLTDALEILRAVGFEQEEVLKVYNEMLESE